MLFGNIDRHTYMSPTIDVKLFLFCIFFYSDFKKIYYNTRGQSWRSGTKCDCNIDWLLVRSSLEEMKYLFQFIFLFLCSGVEARR